MTHDQHLIIRDAFAAAEGNQDAKLLQLWNEHSDLLQRNGYASHVEAARARLKQNAHRQPQLIIEGAEQAGCLIRDFGVALQQRNEEAARAAARGLFQANIQGGLIVLLGSVEQRDQLQDSVSHYLEALKQELDREAEEAHLDEFFTNQQVQLDRLEEQMEQDSFRQRALLALHGRRPQQASGPREVQRIGKTARKRENRRLRQRVTA